MEASIANDTSAAVLCNGSLVSLTFMQELFISSGKGLSRFVYRQLPMTEYFVCVYTLYTYQRDLSQ